MTGERLGPYVLLEKLGEGGMGVVYKARDTRLDRLVAIKKLDPTYASRFEREARAVAALNHPNVCTLHDVGDGYLVMEYVPGLPLSGPKPLDEALQLAVQIASALASAHALGIVHRDVKPANILVTPDGQARVLDFGLARWSKVLPSERDSLTRTLHEDPTIEGHIVGTVPYMSPEQAEGKPVDARSDIFSFGSVLYELLTGWRAFDGGSSIATLAKILQSDPAQLPRSVPATVSAIVNRCLRKDPSRRWQSAAELSAALEDARKDPHSSPRPTPANRNDTPGWRVAAVLLLLAGAGVWITSRNLSTRPSSSSRITPVTNYRALETHPALSPDGRLVAFAWSGEDFSSLAIYVKQFDDAPPLRLSAPGLFSYSPAWSPDGRQIAFLYGSDDGRDKGIGIVSALGGPQRRIADIPILPSVLAPGLSWSPDGKFLFTQVFDAQGSSVSRVQVEDGALLKISTPQAGLRDFSPRVSPNGKSLAFIRTLALIDAESQILVYGLDASSQPVGQPRSLNLGRRPITTFDWAFDSQALLFAVASGPSAGIWSVPAAGGEPRPVLQGFTRISSLSASRQGRQLVFSQELRDVNLWRVAGPKAPAAEEREAKPFIMSPEDDVSPSYSPDGSRIAFASTRSGNQEIWVADGNGRNPRRLTSFSGPPVGSPKWSRDGRWIAFDSRRDGAGDIYLVSPEGGAVRRVTDDPATDHIPQWGPDPGWVYFTSDRGQAPQPGGHDRRRWWRVRVEGGPAELAAPFSAMFSDDGSFLYWQQDKSIWRQRSAGGKDEHLFTDQRINVAAWTVFGEDVIFYDQHVNNSVGVYNARTRKVTTLRNLPRRVTPRFVRTSGIAVSPDGRWIVFSRTDVDDANIQLLENYQ